MAMAKEFDLDTLIQPARESTDQIQVNVPERAKAKIEPLRRRMKLQGQDLGRTLGIAMSKLIDALDAKYPAVPGGNGMVNGIPRDEL